MHPDVIKASRMAQEKWDRTDPTERRPLKDYFNEAMDSIVARRYPGEYHDPLAE